MDTQEIKIDFSQWSELIREIKNISRSLVGIQTELATMNRNRR